MTQRDLVLKLLTEAGQHGVSSHELIYTHGITRGAAVIFDLREDGYVIDTIDEGETDDGRQKLARYVLKAGPTGAPVTKARPTPPPEPEPYFQPLDVPAGPGSDEWAKLGEKLKAEKAAALEAKLAKARDVPWR